MLDQYYTRDDLAEKLCREVIATYDDNYLWVEPSAGTGSFFNHLPADRRLGYDLEPKAPQIIQHDFLTVTTPSQRWAAIGNPPFGRNASLAVRFFNHCAEAELIAFIVPRTFRKPSLVNRLDRSFHCIADRTLPPDSFVFENKSYDVPCCFQIWQRQEKQRSPICEPKSHPDFEFTTRENASFAIQRVGARAGTVKDISTIIAAASHYFIRAADEVRAVFCQIDFDVCRHNTAGNPSISKAELVRLYENHFGVRANPQV